MGRLFASLAIKTEGDAAIATVLNFVTDFDSNFYTWADYLDANETAGGPGLTLIFPAGDYDAFDDPFHKYLALYAPGQNDQTMRLIGAGQDVTSIDGIGNVGGNIPYLRPDNIPQLSNGIMPKIDTILEGETVCTLKIPGDAVNFEVGEWVLLVAYDMQGFGYPQNNNFFQYQRIVSVDGAEVTLDGPALYDYKDTWPQLNYGSPSTPEQYGAATLVPMFGRFWDTHVHVSDITFNPTYEGPFYGNLRKITLEDCTFVNYPHIPSYNKEVTYLNCTIGDFAQMEFDKLVETVTFTNTSMDQTIHIQSTSVDLLTMTDCYISGLSGSTKRMVLTGCEFDDLALGASYGGAYSATFDNCSAGTYAAAGFFVPLSAFSSIAGGVFTITKGAAISSSILPRLVPDPNVWLSLGDATIGIISQAFQITDVTYDLGTETLTYTTTLTGSEPEWAIADNIYTHPCPILTVTNCTGELAPVSFAEAEGMPAGSYYNTGDWDSDTHGFILNESSLPFVTGVLDDQIALWGEVVSITFEVTKAYTGVQSSFKYHPSFFDNMTFVGADGSTITSTWGPAFDLKTLGVRVITPGGVTGTAGTDSGLSLGTRLFWPSGQTLNRRMPVDISGEASSVWPEFKLKIILDQGID